MADDSACTKMHETPGNSFRAGASVVSVSTAYLVNQPPHVANLSRVPGSVSEGIQASCPNLMPRMILRSPIGGAGAVVRKPGPRVAQMHQHQSRQNLNNKLNKFWNKQKEEARLPYGTKNNLLPITRIKKIMKSDQAVRMISAEAPILLMKSCELFILDLTHRAWAYTEEARCRTLKRSDVSGAIHTTDIFDFLVDIVPRDESEMENGAGVMNPGDLRVPITGLGGIPYGGVSLAGMPIVPGPGAQVGMNPAAAGAAASMIYSESNQYAPATTTTGYARDMYYNPQYMRAADTGNQSSTVMYATQQQQYNQNLAGNTAEVPQQPPPPQS